MSNSAYDSVEDASLLTVSRTLDILFEMLPRMCIDLWLRAMRTFEHISLIDSWDGEAGVFAWRSSCDQTSKIICDSCRLARAAKRPVEKVCQKVESSEGVAHQKKAAYNSIKSDNLLPGNWVSIGQYSSMTRGRLTTRLGKVPVSGT